MFKFLSKLFKKPEPRKLPNLLDSLDENILKVRLKELSISIGLDRKGNETEWDIQYKNKHLTTLYSLEKANECINRALGANYVEFFPFENNKLYANCDGTRYKVESIFETTLSKYVVYKVLVDGNELERQETMYDYAYRRLYPVTVLQGVLK
jgi:hypothetical protein